MPSSKKISSKKNTKRTKLIEEKLKNKNSTSLFDTDGDLSRRNIIEGGRRSRKRTCSSDISPTTTSRSTTKRKKTATIVSKPLIKNAQTKLTPKPRTPIQKVRNEWILARETKLQAIKTRHDASVKELYHLEMFQNMLEYNPTSFINDVRYNKYLEDYDIWNALKTNTSFMNRLQDPHILDLLASALFEHSIPSTASSSKAIASYGSPSIHHLITIPTGTGLRRQNRQFPTVKEYMASFIFSDEGADDLSPEALEAFITKERAIRCRLHALHERGGFSTHLQQLANRRPHQHPVKHQFIHDHLLRDMTLGSKIMHTTSKYKRAMARKCAKAVDRYWDTLRSQDERARREEAKRLQRLAKWTCQQVKKKWKVIERVCEARYKEVLKEQQAEEGRKHLEMILEHSKNMLDVRQEELRMHQQNQQMDDEDDVWHDMDQEDVRNHIIEKDDEESDDDEEALRDLEEDQHLSVEELMEKYKAMKEETAGSMMEEEEETASSVMDVEDDDEEFLGANEMEDVPIEDDGKSEDDDTELNALNDDANLTIEQLMEKYKYQPTTSTRSSSVESDHSSRQSSKRQRLASFTTTHTEDDSSVVEDEHANTTAEIQPTGNTLATTKVYTPISPLLRGTLREYQHVGLDWLASLYNNGLNGILADEMGLGKTIQTISLLAYLASEQGVWGPHLVVVPTSVILNWEMEFKKWLPGFKIMTYYGTPKERKEKRVGWSKENAFHVCITSYQLVLQDQSVFRRKHWQYLILDEAHHIKNFRSQRWQVLLNFNSKRRLLLTGTPLQNNLMELWSLLYFLMPNGVSHDMPIGFANLKEFQEWFSHPVDRMIEGQQGVDEESRNAIQKLHTVLRPYLLRRLKADVEKQMPQKHEHIVYCRLSKRQRYLYDDFMARGKTKETLASGNFLSIINCLMQLRKVCNHPDLFEERPILTSFAMDDGVQYVGASIETLVRRRLCQPCITGDKVDLNFLNLILTDASQQAVMSGTVADETMRLEATQSIMKLIGKHQRRVDIAESRGVASRDYHDLKKYAKYRQMQLHITAAHRWQQINYVNHFRCARRPVYDANLIDLLSPVPAYMHSHNPRQYKDQCESLYQAVQSYKTRIQNNLILLEQFGFVTPKVVMTAASRHREPSDMPLILQTATSAEHDIFHPIQSRLSIAFPDKRLLQYDCGKLQKLATLLRTLAAGGHRALIFTQMTRVLDVLEAFLNMHGYRYLRLDGATKVEQRQVLTEHFNNDTRILCFILSTRSGGLGINLTGADTVIFYDSDWNPSMDKQCQDRAHRIGQTRDVHIYRFVTEFTIEENIFKKANQKRMLDNVIIQEGDFTDDYFHKNEWWKDLPEVVGSTTQNTKPIDYEKALLEAEDEYDAAAAIVARKEMKMDENEFQEETRSNEAHSRQTSTSRTSSRQPSVQPSEPSVQPSELSVQPSEPSAQLDEQPEEEDDDDMQLDVGHVDQYMLQFWEREMVGTNLRFGGFPSS